MPIRWLTALSSLLDDSIPPEEAVRRALPLVRDGIDAGEAFLIYGDDKGFSNYGTSDTLGLDDVGLWIIHHELMTQKRPVAFNLDGNHVVDLQEAAMSNGSRGLATLLPGANTGEMLITYGPWDGGVGRERLHALEAALPALALILQRRLDGKQAERRHNQLAALANISRVLSESEDLEPVLTAMSGTIATVTRIDYVSIDVLAADGTIALRCVNSSRPGTEELTARWRRGAERSDPVRDEVIRTKNAMLFPDVQNDERIPESGRNFFIRTLIRSTAVLPLVVKDDVLGVISIASHKPIDFQTQRIELLEALAAQVARAIKAIEVYRELASSRRELQRLNEQLQESMSIQHHLARTDPLTGIPNRRYLEEALEAECARAMRYGQPLSLVMADLDNLKNVNDRHSHRSGDEVLRFVAQVARATCRQADMVARYGGDEFIFVLPATDRDEATAFAERFRRTLEQQPAANPGDGALHLTVSLGVAQWDGECMQAPSCLIAQADRALYRAKATGRNRTMVAVGGGERAA